MMPYGQTQAGQTQAGQQPYNNAQANGYLEAAQNRLNTTSQALKDAQETYQKSNEALTQQEEKLADIQASLKKLTLSKASLVSQLPFPGLTHTRWFIENSYVSLLTT
jgi:chromosome segregation ATPase